MINAASGGALVDKTPEAARNLIANMAANSQQFNTSNDLLPPPKRVNEVSTTSLEKTSFKSYFFGATISSRTTNETVWRMFYSRTCD